MKLRRRLDPLHSVILFPVALSLFTAVFLYARRGVGCTPAMDKTTERD